MLRLFFAEGHLVFLSLPLIKARWGRDGGLGGKGNPSRVGGGVPLPPKNKRGIVWGGKIARPATEAAGRAPLNVG